MNLFLALEGLLLSLPCTLRWKESSIYPSHEENWRACTDLKFFAIQFPTSTKRDEAPSLENS